MLPLRQTNRTPGKRTKSFLSVTGRAFLVWSLTLATVSCTNSIEEIEKLTFEGEEIPEVLSRNILVYYSDSAQMKIIMEAPVLERYIEKGKTKDVMPEGLKVTFLDTNGAPEAWVTCNYAVYDSDQRVFDLRNNVVVENTKGEKMNTEHLVWDANKGKIFSDEFVKITTDDEIIYGDGFEANQDFTAYRIKHIKGIISLEDETL